MVNPSPTTSTRTPPSDPVNAVTIAASTTTVTPMPPIKAERCRILAVTTRPNHAIAQAASTVANRFSLVNQPVGPPVSTRRSYTSASADPGSMPIEAMTASWFATNHAAVSGSSHPHCTRPRRSSGPAIASSTAVAARRTAASRHRCDIATAAVMPATHGSNTRIWSIPTPAHTAAEPSGMTHSTSSSDEPPRRRIASPKSPAAAAPSSTASISISQLGDTPGTRVEFNIGSTSNQISGSSMTTHRAAAIAAMSMAAVIASRRPPFNDRPRFPAESVRRSR